MNFENPNSSFSSHMNVQTQCSEKSTTNRAQLRSIFGFWRGLRTRIANLGLCPIRFLLLGITLGGGAGACAGAGVPASQLSSTAAVDSTGVYLHQVLAGNVEPSNNVVRLCDAPVFGQTLVLTRAQIIEALRTNAPQLLSTNWAGVDRIRVARRTRLLREAEIKQQLAITLQREVVREKGELELRFTRFWTPVVIPDEPYVIHILDLPNAGVTANFIVRFELLVSDEVVGNFQAGAAARIFREVPVARALLRRGQGVSVDDIAFERRDILALRDSPATVQWDDPNLEMMENVAPGAPLFNRAVRVRPAVTRGRVVDARVEEGPLSISVRVEALEDGVLGQTIRVRNPQTKREFKGKVQDAQTIMVVL